MKWITLAFLFWICTLSAHEGHHILSAPGSEVSAADTFNALVKWFGQFHPVLLHFPIALILMAGISEMFFGWTKNPMYHFTSNFLLVAGALFAIPTVLAGLAFSVGNVYQGERDLIFNLHRAMGITALILSFLTVWLRIYTNKSILANLSLAILILAVLTTAYLGGELTFGHLNLLPKF